MLKAKMVDPKAAQRRLYDSIVTKQLDKLEAAARAASTTDQVRNLPSQSGAPRFVCVGSGGCCRAGFDRPGAVSPDCLALWSGWCRCIVPPLVLLVASRCLCRFNRVFSKEGRPPLQQQYELPTFTPPCLLVCLDCFALVWGLGCRRSRWWFCFVALLSRRLNLACSREGRPTSLRT